MKNVCRSITCALILGGATLQAAHADVVSIPYQSGMARGVDQDCYAGGALGWRAYDVTTACEVEFPLSIPAGKTIKQIAILHGTLAANGSADISANLVVYPAPSMGQPSEFAFPQYDDAIYPGLQIVPMNLLRQAGKTFPDAFVVQPNDLYYVDLVLHNDAFVAGIQVNYQ